jgi:hypothetical protein
MKVREILHHRAEVNHAMAKIYQKEDRDPRTVILLAERAALHYCAAGERGSAVEVIREVLGNVIASSYRKRMNTPEYVAKVEAVEFDV